MARDAGSAIDDVPKAMVYELNRRGKFTAMKEVLKQSIVNLVQEKYNIDGRLDAEALQVRGPLRVCLLGAQQPLALSRAADEQAAPASVRHHVTMGYVQIGLPHRAFRLMTGQRHPRLHKLVAYPAALL